MLEFLNTFLMKSLNVLIRSDESAACPRPRSTARCSCGGCSGQQNQPSPDLTVTPVLRHCFVPDRAASVCRVALPVTCPIQWPWPMNAVHDSSTFLNSSSFLRTTALVSCFSLACSEKLTRPINSGVTPWDGSKRRLLLTFWMDARTIHSLSVQCFPSATETETCKVQCQTFHVSSGWCSMRLTRTLQGCCWMPRCFQGESEFQIIQCCTLRWI